MTVTRTIVGWMTIIALGAGFYWVNKQRKNKNKRAIATRQSARAAEPKAKKSRRDGGHSGAEQDGKGQRAQKKMAVHEETTSLVAQYSDGDDEVDNKEFARQLLSAKAGTIAAPKSQASSRPKSVKQGRAQEKQAAQNQAAEKQAAKASSENVAAPSSTTGGDADDELYSPDLSATVISSPVASGDVSDMLEKPAAPAGVLKVLAPTTTSQPSKPKVAKKPETMPETKKQRQNRQKAEEAKELRTQDEEARKVKMEQQRRTAREAEGRAAKDGSSFMSAKVPASSAWAAPSTTTTNGGSGTKNVELLDTYNPTTASPAPASELVYSKSEEDGSARSLEGMSEEEQIRVALHESEGWNLIQAKKDKKGKKISAYPINNGKPEVKGKEATIIDGKPTAVLLDPAAPGQEYTAAVSYTDRKTGEVTHVDIDAQDDEWEVS